eukprot:scaffold94392_cov40-Prasinocladus_malaysianus.AAC.1
MSDDNRCFLAGKNGLSDLLQNLIEQSTDSISLLQRHRHSLRAITGVIAHLHFCAVDHVSQLHFHDSDA